MTNVTTNGFIGERCLLVKSAALTTLLIEAAAFVKTHYGRTENILVPIQMGHNEDDRRTRQGDPKSPVVKARVTQTVGSLLSYYWKKNNAIVTKVWLQNSAYGHIAPVMAYYAPPTELANSIEAALYARRVAFNGPTVKRPSILVIRAVWVPTLSGRISDVSQPPSLKSRFANASIETRTDLSAKKVFLASALLAACTHRAAVQIA